MSVDVTTIGVGFDTSGLDKGTAALDKAGAAADRMAERVGKLMPQAANAGAGMRGMGQATAASAASIDAATKKADEYIKSLQKQLDLYGKSEREIRRYNASAMSMTDAQRKQTDSLLRQNEALDRGDAIGKTLKTGMLALGAATVAAGAAALVMAKNMIDSADAMNDMSQRTGIAVKDLAMYEMAAKQSGTTMAAISIGVKGLSSVMAKHSDDLKAAGITATDADGAMRQLADLFSKMPDGVEKTNLAVKIFGRSGMELIPMLNMGSAGLKEAAEKSAKYAEQMAIMAPLADKYNDNMTEIALSSKAVGMTMLNDALPGILAITRAMADATQKGGIFAGVMAGLSAGMNNYWKGVRGFYGKSESTGGASGSWAEDGRKGMSDPRIVKPAQGIDAKTSGLIKALNSGSGGGGRGSASKVSDYDRAIKAADSYIAKLKEEATETGATAEQVKMLQAAREATKAPTAALKLMIMTQALANEQLRDAVASANKQALAAIEVEKELAKSKLDNINANADQVEKIQESTQSLQDQIRAERDHIVEMGLSKEALNALEIARINDNAAGKDRMATLMQEIDPAIAQAYREQAEALRGLAAAKGDANAKAGALNAVSDYDKMANSFEGMANTASKMGDGFKKATSALGGFASAFKTLAAAEENTKADTIERTQAQVGGYAEMAGAAKNFFDENSAGYEVMTAVEQGFRAVQLALSIAAMVQGTAEAATSQANSAGNATASTIAGVAKAFEQMGVFGFVGAAAILAFMASMGGGSSGGGAGGGASGGGIGGNGTYAGSGNEITATGRVTSSLGNRPNGTEADESLNDARNLEAIKESYRAADAANKLADSLRTATEGMTQLETDLQAVKTASQGAGRAQYELATNGMSEAELAAYNYNAALNGQIQVLLDAANGTSNASDNMKTLANDAVNLAIDLKRASGDIAGANRDQMLLDTVGYSEQEIAMYNHNQSLRAQIESYSAGASAANDAAQAEQELAQTRYDLSGRLNVLLGRQTQLQFDRATELAGVTDEASITMLNLIYQLEDYNTALDDSYAKLERSVAAEKKIAELRLNSALNTFNALKTAKASIGQSLDRATAQSQLSMYLALAKAGGVLPTAEALRPVLASLTAGSFATAQDEQRNAYQTANTLQELSGYAAEQISEAQVTIDYLDQTLVVAKEQLNALRGIDESVTSVFDAVNSFATALTQMTAAQAGAGSYSYSAPTASASSGGGGGGGGYSGATSAADPAIAGMNRDIVAAYREYYSRNPDQSGYDFYVQSGLQGNALMQLILAGSSGDPNGADYQNAVSRGYNPNDPTAKFLRSILNPTATNNSGSNSDVSYNSFAVGANYIPSDQMAYLHRGEEIRPAAFVDTERNSRELTNQLLQQLIQENKEMKLELSAIKSASTKTADSTGNTERKINRLAGERDRFTVEVAA